MFGASQVAGHLQKLIAHVRIGTEGFVVADRSMSDAKLVKQVPFIHGWPPTNALRIDLQFSPVSGLFASANDLLICAGLARPRKTLAAGNKRRGGISRYGLAGVDA